MRPEKQLIFVNAFQAPRLSSLLTKRAAKGKGAALANIQCRPNLSEYGVQEREGGALSATLPRLLSSSAPFRLQKLEEGCMIGTVFFADPGDALATRALEILQAAGYPTRTSRQPLTGCIRVTSKKLERFPGRHVRITEDSLYVRRHPFLPDNFGEAVRNAGHIMSQRGLGFRTNTPVPSAGTPVTSLS